MQTNQITYKLYQTHETMLASLGYQSLTAIAQHSFATFRKACRSTLSWAETRSIYLQAKQHVAGLSAQRRKLLTHANPQLKNMMHLALNPMQQQTQDYETLFGQRADAYVPNTSVASMFSPAAYLTELYREGKQLHTVEKLQHLDKRRPDLQSLALSQGNQDAEITTLALSNDILLSTIQTHTQQNDAQLRESLSNTGYPFDLPYHIPFSSIETALAVQNTRFDALAQTLEASQNENPFPATTRACYVNHLSPGLRRILLEPIPTEEMALNDSLRHHFGTADIEQLSDVEYFCRRVGISRDELNAFLALPSFLQTNHAQSNHDVHVPLLQPPQQFGCRYLNATRTEWLGFQNNKISRISVTAPSEIMARLHILPSINDSCIKFAAVSSIVDNKPSTHIDIKIDDKHLTADLPDTIPATDQPVWTVPLYDGYRVFEFEVTKNDFKLQIGVGDANIYNPGAWYPSSAPATDNFHVLFSVVDAVSLIKLSQLIRYVQKTNLSPAGLDNGITLSQDSAAPTSTITEATLQLTARVLEYQQRYSLGEDDALVQAGAVINVYAPAGELSQFDRLFNNPPLNDVPFTINDGDDTISFDPTDTTYAQERAVLKRALGVDDAGLATLAAIVNHVDSTWARSLSNISTLYRVGLWARVHGLNPQELEQLLLLNDKTEDLLDQPYATFVDYLDAIYRTSQWLSVQQLSVSELNVMTTHNYPGTMTPAIDSFIRTLYQAGKAADVEGTFDVASVSNPTTVAGDDLVAEVCLTSAINATGKSEHIYIKVESGSATTSDYDANAILAECLDDNGTVLTSQPGIRAEGSWGEVQAMPVGTVVVRLTLPTLMHDDATDKQLFIKASRIGYPEPTPTGVATITPASSQTSRSQPTHAHSHSQSPRSAMLPQHPIHQLLAPHIAAAFSLDNVDSAVAQQVWIEQIAGEQGLSLTNMLDFYDAIVGYCESDDPTVEECAKLATFSQALGQLAFIIKRWKLSSAALSVAVSMPWTIQADLGFKLSLTLSTQQAIGRFIALQLCAGKAIDECLTLLVTNKLTAAELARWRNVPESEVILAAHCVGADENMMNASQAAFVLDWLDQAAALGVSVQVVEDLLTCQVEGTSYGNWQKLAGAVLAGVAEPELGQMNIWLDEALSTALCAYFLNTVAPRLPSSISIQDRDDLFCYLLIDNQVSGQITTSRIAEAISSVQLYINRCLQGREADIDDSLLVEEFFVQWDVYNKRYSTWAGVSQLVYYPENYIDPTLRYNQSSLQSNLLNELNQSQLNKDSVESAYLNYLSSFEDIANLKVLCGYHHGTELDNGLSYFIGRSTGTPYRYYWRSLNLNAGDGLGGYAASAWTDWEEMPGQPNPISNEVRPVIFNNRLYVAWITQQMVSDGVDTNGEPIQHIRYSLQLSYRKINGDWAPAMSFALPAIPAALFDEDQQPIFSLYLSYHPLQDAILFMLYDSNLDSSYYDGADTEGPAYGGFIGLDMQLTMVEDSQDDWVNIYSLFSNNLNDSSTLNKIIRRINAITYDANVVLLEKVDTTNSDDIVVSGVEIADISVNDMSVPAYMSYIAQGTIETKHISSLPQETISSGYITDRSGAGFDVQDVTVTCVDINDVECEFIASAQVYAKNGGRYGPVNTSVDIVAAQGAGGAFLSNISARVVSSVDGDGLEVSFTWTANEGSGGCGYSQKVSIKSAGREIYYDTHNQENRKFNVYFFAVIPTDNESGVVTYRVDTNSTNGNCHWGAWDLHVHYGDVYFPKRIKLSLAGTVKEFGVPSAGVYSYDMPYSLRLSQDGSAISETHQLSILVGERVRTDWSQALTFGHTAYTPDVTFTYDWGEGEIALPQQETTIIDHDYELALPVAGQSHYRTLTVKQDGLVVFKQRFQINAYPSQAELINPTDNIRIIEGDNGALYLENTLTTVTPKRTRLNTLFAHELVKRAQAGLDNVLSWDTQHLPEPALGKGFYVDVVLDKYDPAVHGTEKWFRLYYAYFYAEQDYFICYEGWLSDTQTVIARIFYPYPQNGWNQNTVAYLEVEYQSGRNTSQSGQSMTFRYDPATNSAVWERSAKGIISNEPDNSNPTEPMDFRGANSLYFWELFYYTPMLVAEKLLQSQDFEESERWLNYVFNPAGYLEGRAPNMVHVDRQWNTRPLEEDTAWDDMQTDSTDPDVVAQADPMHYKLATFMKRLDLLIARGDMAYRQLERDSLAEAKMWYVAAQQLLGPQPDLPQQGNWSDPTLAMAASNTTAEQSMLLMERLMLGDVRPLDLPAEQPERDIAQVEVSGEGHSGMRTANSLTALFLPSENDKLNGYWQTLAQRMFNLRHNLSIDGQPLTLPLYATPADPKALQSAAAASASGVNALPTNATIAILRFPVMLESARSLVGQLIQYGSTLTSVLERKDGEALSMLLQTQAKDLMQRSLQLQDKTIEQLQADQETLSASLNAAEARRDSYQRLLNEGVSDIERQSINERIASGSMSISANAMRTAGATMDLAPNIFGFSVGGSHWGALTEAVAFGMDISAAGLATSAEAHSATEQYRRRQQEWTIQRDAAEHECTQLEAQQRSLAIQLEAARLQKDTVALQQSQTQAQMDFLKTKFTNEALYSWMQGRLSAVFYQFYDLAIARCMRAQRGYQWETKDTATFIQPGAWDSNHAGLLSGEALLLNLAQMESAYLEWNRRALEVNRTISMAQAMSLDSAAFNAAVNSVLNGTASSATPHTLAMGTDPTVFIASLDLKALAIANDYPDTLLGSGSPLRSIKQISVSLPALLGPYQDIQAVLGYSGNGNGIHQSCTHTAISHGINDSGQFQLDFNDSQYLPFEGLPIDGDGTAKLTLSFPNAGDTGKQRAILQSLNDIVLHIRYTIRD